MVAPRCPTALGKPSCEWFANTATATNRTARGLVGRAHRPGRRDHPRSSTLLLLGDPRRRRRGALRAGHADRPVPDPPRARPRGLAARAPDAGNDRRRAADPARGIARRAGRAPRSRLPVRRRRPAQASRRTRPDGLGRALLGRRARRPSTCCRLGHRRIAAITGPRGWIATEERLRGYHGALAAAGVMPDPELVVESNFDVEGGVEAALSLLDRPDPPTAIFAFNDMLAIGAMQAARAARRSASPTTCRSSASTTRSRPRSSRRR